VTLDSFRCTAKDLARYRLKSESMWLRRDDDSDDSDDSDDPGTWQLVRTIRHANFGSMDDPGLRDVELITVSFHDETLALALNLTAHVECAVPRHARLPES
jgi:hypothetical protein